MEFEVKKVCCCTNLERDLYNVSVGDFVYVADSLTELKRLVEKNDVSEAMKLSEIQEGKVYPFGVKFDDILNNCFYAFAYKCDIAQDFELSKADKLLYSLAFINEFRNSFILREVPDGSTTYQFMKGVVDCGNSVYLELSDGWAINFDSLYNCIYEDSPNYYMIFVDPSSCTPKKKKSLKEVLKEFITRQK